MDQPDVEMLLMFNTPPHRSKNGLELQCVDVLFAKLPTPTSNSFPLPKSSRDTCSEPVELHHLTGRGGQQDVFTLD